MRLDKAQVTQRITLDKKDIGLILQTVATFMAPNSEVEQKILDAKSELMLDETCNSMITVVLMVEN